MGGSTTPPGRGARDVVVVGAPAFVAAKIATPNVGRASIRREVLDALRAGGQRRLLLVRAPAGYGKTAVVAEASRRLGWRAVWYKIDVLDHDPAVLVTSLVQGVRRLVPEFGQILIERFAGAHEAPMSQTEMVGLLTAELQDEVVEPLYLVLDDYHEAVGSSGLNDTIGYLVNSVPDHIHVVLLTRCRPRVSISKLKLGDQIAEITYEDLRLDSRQLAEMLEHRTGQPIGADQADRLSALTEGWPASLVLIGRALDWSDVETIEKALTDPRMTSDVFSYLSEEALRHEDAETATFMTRTCCLDSMTAELAGEVARTDQAHRHLDGLVSRNVFTFLDGRSGTYRYHQLFRDYLRHRYIEDEGPRAFHDLQLHTAEAVERAGDPETAIELCFAANEPEAALAVVSRSGDLITENCRLEALDSWLERLPLHLRDRDPWGLFLLAHRCLREGGGDEALVVLERALELFRQRQDRWGAYHTLSSIEAIHFWKGEFRSAAEYCKQALAVADTPLQKMHTTVSIGSAHSYQAHWQQAERSWRDAEAMTGPGCEAELVRILALRANMTYLRGRYIDALEDLDKVIGRVRAETPLAFTAAALGVRVDIERRLAQYSEALTTSAEALAVCDRYGLQHLRYGVEATAAIAGQAFGQGEHTVAELERIEAEKAVRSDVWLQTNVLLELASVRRYRGELEEAAAVSSRAITCASAQKTPALSLLSDASSALSAGLAGGDQDLIGIGKAAASSGLRFVALQCSFWDAVLAFLEGKQAYAIARLRACVPLQLRLGHNDFLVSELSTYPDAAEAVLLDPDLSPCRDTLLGLLARTALSDPLLGRLLARSDGLAEAVMRVTVPALPQDRALPLLRAAKRHPSAAIRRAAWKQAPKRTGSETRALEGLSGRELQVLELMSQGARNPEIASRLFLSERTVKTHVNHIFTKLGVTDRIQAVLYYKDTIGPPGDDNTTTD